VSGNDNNNNKEKKIMYLHCADDSTIAAIKAHAKEVGKVELVGRNDLDLANHSTDWSDYNELDWEWQGWGEGAVYCLKESTGAATAYGRTCFVLIPELSEYDTSVEIENKSGLGGEILVPLEDFEIAEIIIDGEHHFSPEEWVENSDMHYI
jgi:hypothetical protein